MIYVDFEALVRKIQERCEYAEDQKVTTLRRQNGIKHVGTGFVRFFGLKIQGLLKDFQGHIFHFSRTPRTAKSKDVQLLIVAIVPS